jgi:hypothetical protein
MDLADQIERGSGSTTLRVTGPEKTMLNSCRSLLITRLLEAATGTLGIICGALGTVNRLLRAFHYLNPLEKSTKNYQKKKQKIMSVGFNLYYNTREHILSYHNKFKDPLCEQVMLWRKAGRFCQGLK